MGMVRRLLDRMLTPYVLIKCMWMNRSAPTIRQEARDLSRANTHRYGGVLAQPWCGGWASSRFENDHTIVKSPSGPRRLKEVTCRCGYLTGVVIEIAAADGPPGSWDLKAHHEVRA